MAKVRAEQVGNLRAFSGPDSHLVCKEEVQDQVAEEEEVDETIADEEGKPVRSVKRDEALRADWAARHCARLWNAHVEVVEQ